MTFSSGSAKGRYVATHNPSEGQMYQAFAIGCCTRMGDIVKLLEMYEDEYQSLDNDV